MVLKMEKNTILLETLGVKTGEKMDMLRLQLLMGLEFVVFNRFLFGQQPIDFYELLLISLFKLKLILFFELQKNAKI